MISLRPYQSDIIDRVRDAMREHRSVLAVAPTGSGKTVLSAFMLGTARQRGKRSWFIAHRDFLLEQTAQTFDQVGIPYGFIAAGRYQDPCEAVQICSIGTLQRRLARYHPPDLIVWDEVHHIAAKSYRTVYEWAAKSRHVGLTATPCRLDGRGLGDFFGAIVEGPTTGTLIEQGHLSRYKAFAPSRPNMDGIHTRAGDYARDELDHLMDDGQIIGDMVGHYRKYADGRRAIFFAVSIAHSQHIAASFNASGIPALHVDGTDDTATRIEAAKAFGRGDVRVLCNCELFGEGFDIASQARMDVTVEAVGLARPTQSLGLHLQQIGRALRPKDRPAVILDFAGNLLRHGLPDDEREWSLAGVAKKKKAGDSLAVTQCGHCFGVYRSTLAACPYCGTVRVVQGGREVEEVAGELAEVVARPRVVDLDRVKAKGYDALVALAQKRGYRNPARWAMYVHEAREKKAAERASQGRWV